MSDSEDFVEDADLNEDSVGEDSDDASADSDGEEMPAEALQEDPVDLRSAVDESDLSTTLDEIAQFDKNDVGDHIRRWHPQECFLSMKEVAEKSVVHRGDDERIIDDDMHTFSKMTKFEKTRIIGIRQKQLEHGANSFIVTDLTDSYLIAQEELRQKAIPFFVVRYIPHNRTEIFRAKDLEIVE